MTWLRADEMDPSILQRGVAIADTAPPPREAVTPRAHDLQWLGVGDFDDLSKRFPAVRRPLRRTFDRTTGGLTMSRPVISLAAAVAPARTRHRELVEAARRWSLAERSWLRPDHVALIVATWPGAIDIVVDDGTLTGPPDDAETATFWTRTLVNALLMQAIPDWCLTHSTTCPHLLPEAIWRFLDFLAETDRLHAESDPIVELRRPLRCLGQLGDDGRWDEGLGADPGPCVCFSRYTGPTYGDLRVHVVSET